MQSLAGCVPPLCSFLSSIEAGRGTGGSYLDRWVNTSSSGDRARLSPRRKRTSLGVPKCNLNYFETFFYSDFNYQGHLFSIVCQIFEP